MFKGKLYEEQKPAAGFLVNKRKGLLAWEQGTGKTVIALAACEKLFELGKANTAMILVPPAFAWQWEEKIHEFTSSRVVLAEAKKKATRTYKPIGPRSYYIVPYSLWRRDFDTIVRNLKPDIVIADEAQEFRNNKTKTYKLMLAFNRRVNPRYRWALTGTAIANKLEELYSIFYWIDKSFLPPWPVFEKRHIVRNDLGLIYKYKDLRGLHTYLRTRMDRKTHEDLKGQMPSIVYQTIKVPSTPAYRKAEATLLRLLDDMASDIRIDKDGEIRASGKSSAAVRKAFHAVRKELNAAKLAPAVTLANNLLNESGRNKAVLFNHNKGLLYNLQSELGGLLFTGDQTPEEKRNSVRSFAASTANDLQSRILIASDAAKAGLDLPYANYAVNCDIPFSFEVLDQRNKRITRASSSFPTVVVIYLVMEDSIEEFFYEVTMNKGRLLRAVKEGKEDEVIIRPSSLRAFIRGDSADTSGTLPHAEAAGKAPKKAKGRNSKKDKILLYQKGRK